METATGNGEIFLIIGVPIIFVLSVVLHILNFRQEKERHLEANRKIAEFREKIKALEEAMNSSESGQPISKVK